MTKSLKLLQNIMEFGATKKELSLLKNDTVKNCQERFLNALLAQNTPHSPSSQDLACLIRHIMRREDEILQGGIAQTLKIPRVNPYPSDREMWEKCGCDILQASSDFFVITARPWQFFGQTPDQSVFAETNRRNYQEERGDPFLNLVNLDKYRSVGQREAIRAVLTAPAKSTLVINLPTGSGKSLVAQLPALLDSQVRGVSVMVVPTTALALDQEKSLQKFIPHPVAYYSDNSSEGKQRRQGIKNRICEGKQRLVIVSPESLLDSLSPSLYFAAKRGFLRYFIVDEAHTVEQWGDNFRPAFQELPALRDDLLRITSFKTLLLSATITESCLDSLQFLFGKNGDFQIISAVQLRPEIEYYFSYCEDEIIRKERLLAALYHLPRPLIIYVTTKDDVEYWSQIIRAAGFKRFGIMTGDSTIKEREELIKNWREKNIDLVIATSSFGLGIDQADIRAVIHVCIPETIDRFYQEVGRGGRDGKAAISLTLYTLNDYKIAHSLNQKTTITLARGLQRWESMFAAKITLSDGRFRIPINLPPSFKDKDIDMNSLQNRAWNIRTLNLMGQAKLIEIYWEKPPQKNQFQSEKDYQQAYENYYNYRLISIINEQHLTTETWESEIEPIRKKRQRINTHNLKLMKEALKYRQTRCISEIFAQAYNIPDANVNVSCACGGCNYCRFHKQKPFANILPFPLPVWPNPDDQLSQKLTEILGDQKLLLIFYDLENNKQKKGKQIINWLVNQGIINIVANPKYYPILEQELQSLSNNYIFFFEDYQPFKMPRVPTLILLDRPEDFGKKYLRIQNYGSCVSIILLSRLTPHPEKPDRLLINMFNGLYFTLEYFCREIGL